MVHNAQDFENSNFPINFKWSNFINKKTIFVELGLYCSKHCVSTIEVTIDIL
jgi:hypothetical protein